MTFYHEDSLYYIFSQIIRLHYHRLHTLLDQIGIYPGQPPLLFVLYIKNGQSQKELADKLHIKPATITMMVRRMEKAKLVKRYPDPKDQRISRVYLTEEGKKVYQEVHAILKKIDLECFKNFTEEERILLRRFFIQMRDNLAEVCDVNF